MWTRGLYLKSDNLLIFYSIMRTEDCTLVFYSISFVAVSSRELAILNDKMHVYEEG